MPRFEAKSMFFPGLAGGGEIDLADCRLRSESALRFLSFSTLGANHAELSAEFRAGRDVFLYRGLLLKRKRDLLVAQIDLLRDAVRRVKRLYPDNTAKSGGKVGNKKPLPTHPYPAMRKSRNIGIKEYDIRAV